MNIIREAYHPYEMVTEDHPFAPVYKDCDLTLLGKLPMLLVQKKILYFTVNDLHSDIFKYDSFIGRRMIGMGIKQIAIYGLFEKDKIHTIRLALHKQIKNPFTRPKPSGAIPKKAEFHRLI